jgi:hypothetical protein
VTPKATNHPRDGYRYRLSPHYSQITAALDFNIQTPKSGWKTMSPPFPFDDFIAL